MATDFISRKDAKDKHCEICEHLNICYQYDGDDCRTYTGRTCIERQCFNAIPAADVRPVVRGTWESGAQDFQTGYTHTCSVCGGFINMYVGGAEDDYNFCPNCGADMRGTDSSLRSE